MKGSCNDQQQLEASTQLQSTLVVLKSLMREKLFETRVSGRVGLKWQGYIGVNQAALRLLKRKLDEKNEVFGEEKRSKILCSFCFTKIVPISF